VPYAGPALPRLVRRKILADRVGTQRHRAAETPIRWATVDLPERAFAYAVIAIVASLPATLAAVWLYLAILVREPFAWSQVHGVLAFGVFPSIYGAVLAIVPAVVLALLRQHLKQLPFIGVAALAAVGGAISLGLLVTRNSPHVSALYACALLAITWCATAVVLASRSRPVA
jgi:hypothetical protein